FADRGLCQRTLVRARELPDDEPENGDRETRTARASRCCENGHLSCVLCPAPTSVEFCAFNRRRRPSLRARANLLRACGALPRGEARWGACRVVFGSRASRTRARSHAPA